MDPDKVQGDIQRPFQQEPEASDKIDPEKFKKVMKVEDTDEAQKRNKRNLKREEEEGEGEDVEEKVAPPPASTSFSEFMSDKDQLNNVLDSESGGVRYQAAPEEDDAFVAPEAGSINTEGVDLDESEAAPPQGKQQQAGSEQEQAPPTPQPQPSSGSGYVQEPPASSEESFSPPMYEGDFEEQPFQPQQPTNQEQQPQGTTSEDSQNTQQAQQPQEKGDEKPPEKKKEEDASLLASQPKMSDLIPKKKTKKPAAEVKMLPKDMQTPQEGQKISDVIGKATNKLDGTPLSESNIGKDQATSASFEGIEGTEKGGEEELTTTGSPKGDDISEAGGPPQKTDTKTTHPFRRLTPQEVRNQRLGKEETSTAAALEGMVVPSSGKGQKGEMGKKKKDDDDAPFIEATSETASIILPTFETPIAPVAETQTTPSYTRLTPEVHELFEKMGGVMVVQLDKGITTTTMNINMPNSVFNGAQVILDQYSSAPHSYNLQLIGSPEAVKLFTSNMTQLENSFKQANFNFEVNILNPSITQTKKPPHLIRRGSSAGGKGGGDKGKSGN
ncbi:hypothetical protein [Candidatus Neptunichlamydia sp. REUL1]|uniref:hypothetical protein n=1 Tax=Candidatus Neptunichlamydia sp. REUL1 TaxID=3064277 RepID=UPI00292E7CC7|nr:hypothetical protein [Candidatus Neptunochlamydia sp. REUL1]